MMRWVYAAAATLLSFAAWGQTCPTTGATCNATINQGTGLTAAIEARTAGQTLCLNPGTYTTATTPAWADPNAFGIGKSVTVCGLGGSPSNVVLQGSASSDYAVKFVNYLQPIGTGTPNNATLANVRVTNSNGGILIYNYTGNGGARLSGISLRNVEVNPKTVGGSAFGVFLQATDRINLDQVTISSTQTNLFMLDANETLVQNSTLTQATGTGVIGFSVMGGTDNVIVGNTIGTQGQTYSFDSAGIVLYNTKNKIGRAHV